MKKQAYIILAHQDPDHLKELVEALDYQSHLFVHIDKKSDMRAFEFLDSYGHVTLIDRRLSLHWSNISITDAQLLIMEEVLKSAEEFSHIIFLSGSCFPIKPMSHIHQFFLENGKKEFIKYVDMRDSPDHFLRFVKFKYFSRTLLTHRFIFTQFLDKAIRKCLTMLRLKNHWNDDFIPYFGSAWVALTTECCRYVIDFHGSDSSFRKMNKYTHSPDEHYLHTIIGNSEFKNSATGLISLDRNVIPNLGNLHIIHISLSKWFTLEDWDEIVSSDKLFVRKVNSVTGKSLVNRLKKEIL